MPKANSYEQQQNGSETHTKRIKICKMYHQWTDQYLALAPPSIIHIGSVEMKRSVRPLFTLLLLIAFAATLSCRALVRNSIHKTRTLPVVFNATLLKYSAIDISQEKEKKEIELLLEGNFNSPSRYRSFSTWRRFNSNQNRYDLKPKTSTGVLVMLRSPSFYRYWLEFRKVLQDWKRRKMFQPEVMMELVRLVKGPIDRYNGVFDGFERKYASCAVVGNSGILLKTDYGELIDSHEVVIRLNNARVSGYRSKVGGKTSFSFVNSNILHLCARREGCFCHPYGDNVPMVMYVCQPVHFMDYMLCNSSHKAPLIVTDPRFDVLCMRIVKYYSLKRFVEETGKSLSEWGSAHDGAMFHYSSGMQSVMLALGICDRVSLFGFGKSTSAKHHYHTNQKAELRLHDYVAEYDFYHDLVERPQAIPFLPDKFKIPPVTIYH